MWELDGEEEEVMVEELMEGDVVTHVQNPIDKTWDSMLSLGGPIIGWLISHTDDVEIHGHMLFTTGKKGPVELLAYLENNLKYKVRKLKTSAKPVDKSRWPGTCDKCGKGTYVGMNVVEHDGPCK